MMDEERNAIPYGNIMLARNAIRDVAPLRRNMQFDGMSSCIRSVVRETDMQRRTFLGTTVLGATLMTVSAPAVQAANTEWDKTFALDDRVAHEKVRFTNRFGIELAADLYRPKNLTGKLPAIAVSGPFGAVKEQSSGLYAQELAIRGFVTVAFDPSFTGESGGVARNVASPDINAEDFSAAVDYLSLRDDVDPEKIGICGICGWGGLSLRAAMLDTRIKATVASTMYDMCRVTGQGYFDSMDANARHEMMVKLNAQRTSDAKAGKLSPMFLTYEDIRFDVGTRKIFTLLRAIQLFGPLFDGIDSYDIRAIDTEDPDYTFTFQTRRSAYPEHTRISCKGTLIIDRENYYVKNMTFDYIDYQLLRQTLLTNRRKTSSPFSTHAQLTFVYDSCGQNYISSCHQQTTWKYNLGKDFILIEQPSRHQPGINRLIEKEAFHLFGQNKIKTAYQTDPVLVKIHLAQRYPTGKYDSAFFHRLPPLLDSRKAVGDLNHYMQLDLLSQ